MEDRKNENKYMKSNSGLGLIISIFLILLFSLLTIIAASMFSTDIQISIDSHRSTQAFYIAEAAKNYYMGRLYDDYIKDRNWSNNSPVTWQAFGNGGYSVEYIDIANKPKNEATIRFTGKVDNITRQILCNFEMPFLPSGFNWCYYTGSIYRPDGPVIYNNCTGRENVPDDEMIDLSFDYQFFKDNAAKEYPSGFSVDGNNSLTLNGIQYVKGNFEITNYNNVTIEGSVIVVGGSIILENIGNLNITPSEHYPALITTNRIQIFNVSGYIEGGIFTDSNTLTKTIDIKIRASNELTQFGILYSEKDILIELLDLSNSKFTSRGTIISHNQTRIEDIDDSETVSVLWDPVVLFYIEGITNKNAKPQITSWMETY